MHFKTRGRMNVKRGGGILWRRISMELPALSWSESFLKPTTMLTAIAAMDARIVARHPVMASL